MIPSRLFDFVTYQIEQFPQEAAVTDLVDGKTTDFSIYEIDKISNQIAHGLLSIGLKPGDKLAMVVYRNRSEFTLLDLGMQKAGIISVPLYPTISPREYAFILSDAACKGVFFGGGDLGEKIEKASKEVHTLEHLYSLEPDSDHKFWKSVWEEMPDTLPEQINVKEEDLATIIYTSGTTGNPKGVMLSHRNIVQNVLAVKEHIPVKPGYKVMSFLPLSHIFERSASFAYLYLGAHIVYTAIDHLGGEEGDLQRVKPRFLTCVPRLLEKIYEKIEHKGRELSGVKHKLFFWALALTDDYAYDKRYTGWQLLQRLIADRLIFSKWREALGGQVVGIITGSAPCPEKIARVFSAAGIPIREGYGLTETSPGLTINGFAPGQALLGSVGKPLHNVEISIDTKAGDYREGEGEILAYGPNIMLGYYQRKEATDSVFTEIDGKLWFRTGDIGMFVKGPGGSDFLKITDRKKELLKTSSGKYVAPAPLESKLKEEALIEQCMVVGDARKYVAAILLPAADALRSYCKTEGITWQGLDETLKLPDVVAWYKKIVDKINADFARHEQIKQFCLVPDTWLPVHPDGTEGELTPTLKLKRRVLETKYADLIGQMYHEQKGPGKSI